MLKSLHSDVWRCFFIESINSKLLCQLYHMRINTGSIENLAENNFNPRRKSLCFMRKRNMIFMKKAWGIRHWEIVDVQEDIQVLRLFVSNTVFQGIILSQEQTKVSSLLSFHLFLGTDFSWASWHRILKIRHLHKYYASSIAFFKEFELVGKFFKRATKNWKILCDHALQTHIQSRLRLLHVDNFKIILSLQKQLNL